MHKTPSYWRVSAFAVLLLSGCAASEIPSPTSTLSPEDEDALSTSSGVDYTGQIDGRKVYLRLTLIRTNGLVGAAGQLTFTDNGEFFQLTHDRMMGATAVLNAVGYNGGTSRAQQTFQGQLTLAPTARGVTGEWLKPAGAKSPMSLIAIPSKLRDASGSLTTFLSKQNSINTAGRPAECILRRSDVNMVGVGAPAMDALVRTQTFTPDPAPFGACTTASAGEHVIEQAAYFNYKSVLSLLTISKIGAKATNSNRFFAAAVTVDTETGKKAAPAQIVNLSAAGTALSKAFEIAATKANAAFGVDKAKFVSCLNTEAQSSNPTVVLHTERDATGTLVRGIRVFCLNSATPALVPAALEFGAFVSFTDLNAAGALVSASPVAQAWAP